MRRKSALVGLAGPLVLTAASLVSCDKPPPPPSPPGPSAAPPEMAPPPRVLAPTRDAREHAYDEPRRVLARIQGDLERVAAGKPRDPFPSEAERHPLEAFVSAYQAFLTSDLTAREKIDAVAADAKKRLEEAVSAAKKEAGDDGKSLYKRELESTDAYLRLVSAAAEDKTEGAAGLMIRLAATLRLVDAALLAASKEPFYNITYDYFTRIEGSVLTNLERWRDEIFLRLPCRTVAGRRAEMEAAHKRLEKAAGPLSSCPTPSKREADFEWMERFVKDPAALAAEAIPKKEEPRPSAESSPDPEAPKPPWSRDAAIIFMGDNPNEAEKPLEAGAKKDTVGKLDYVLFLHTFRPASKARDDKIKRLIGEIEAASKKAAKAQGDEFLMEESALERRAYDGTDESLLGLLRLASSTGAANTTSAFYAIPCAVMIARPKLVDATEPLFGGNRDNFVPRSGCSWGRGFVRGFPDAEVSAWRNASDQADGNFYMNHGGTARFALGAAQNVVEETMRANPRHFVEKGTPKMAMPYETWSYMNPENRTVYLKLARLAGAAKEKLVAHYKTRGFSEKEANDAALNGLSDVVWGSACGGAAPPRSVRKLVVDGAPAAEIRAFFQAGEHKDPARLAPFLECAKAGAMDPLAHVAVLNPGALQVLWEQTNALVAEDPQKLDLVFEANAPNAFGKTPLMAAAQQDQIESARFLLDHGASPFATTLAPPSTRLGHDARTALMYAAARGSLAMIKLLLDAGIDKYAADTKGRIALHYLLGHGPVAANPKLSGAELAEAVKLLY